MFWEMLCTIDTLLLVDSSESHLTLLMWTPRLPLLGVKLSPQSHTAPLHVLVVLFGQSLYGISEGSQG